MRGQHNFYVYFYVTPVGFRCTTLRNSGAGLPFQYYRHPVHRAVFFHHPFSPRGAHQPFQTLCARKSQEGIQKSNSEWPLIYNSGLAANEECTRGILALSELHEG